MITIFRYERFGVVALLVLPAVIAGCASQRVGRTPSCGANASADTVAQCKWIQLTPLSRVWTGFDDPDEQYSNFYTRVLINSRHTRDDGSVSATGASTGSDNGGVSTPSPLTLAYNSRNPLLRALWGKHFSLNLTAYITLGTFQATVPLVTIDHTSDHSNGEKFVRIVAQTVQNFPLVLLRGDGSNAIATVHFIVKATDTTQSNAAATAIEAAQGIANTLAPEASVVTALNSQTAKDKAVALDKVINSVLARQLDEEQWVDNDVRRWGKGVMVTFLIPPPDHETAWNDTADFRQVGTWTLAFETPRPSVFSDIQICLKKKPTAGAKTSGAKSPAMQHDYCRATRIAAAQAAEADAASRPEQVLNFNLLNGSQSLGTVGAYLKQQSWWESSLKTFGSLQSGHAPDGDSVSQFCRAIKQTIVGVGLNVIDASIVVAAVRDQGPLPVAVSTAMKSNADCKYFQFSAPPTSPHAT